jgi:hypothetical protein
MEDVLNRFTLFLCVACGTLVLSCGSVPAPAAAPELFSELSELLGQFPDMRTETLSRHRNESITAADYEHYIVIKRTLDSYEGGAHGMYRTDYRVFDRSTARFVTLADIAGETALADLREAVAEALREKFELGEGERLTDAGLFEDEVELTENFFLNGNGIGFHWNPYDLAPYTFGEIEVVVPLK